MSGSEGASSVPFDQFQSDVLGVRSQSHPKLVGVVNDELALYVGQYGGIGIVFKAEGGGPEVVVDVAVDEVDPPGALSESVLTDLNENRRAGTAVFPMAGNPGGAEAATDIADAYPVG